MASQQLARRIVARREAANLTQEALSRRARIARGYLAKLERGYSVNPSLGVLGRLARALGCSLAELLG